MWYYRLWDILRYFYLKYLVFQAMWYYQLWDILRYYLPEIACISGYVVLSTWGYFSVLFTWNILYSRLGGTIDLGVFCSTTYLPKISCSSGYVVQSNWEYFAVLFTLNSLFFRPHGTIDLGDLKCPKRGEVCCKHPDYRFLIHNIFYLPGKNLDLLHLLIPFCIASTCMVAAKGGPSKQPQYPPILLGVSKSFLISFWKCYLLQLVLNYLWII